MKRVSRQCTHQNISAGGSPRFPATRPRPVPDRAKGYPSRAGVHTDSEDRPIQTEGFLLFPCLYTQHLLKNAADADFNTGVSSLAPDNRLPRRFLSSGLAVPPVVVQFRLEGVALATVFVAMEVEVTRLLTESRPLD